MHPVRVRIHHFFVPNRIVWPEAEEGGWENFITGGNDGITGDPPQITTFADKKTLSHYMGVPLNSDGINIMSLPIRAVNKIINEYYLDQDLQTQRTQNDNTLPNIAWEKDYFSSARPWAQRGPAVTLPIGERAPVVVDADYANPGGLVSLGGSDGNQWGMQQTGAPIDWSGGTNPAQPEDYHLIADLSKAESIDINAFRVGFALQRYQEARARYGARFTEYLRYLGITPSDARLQRPEFLGGGATRLNFSEVLQTAPTDASGGPEEATGIGDLFGHGIAGIRSNAYRKFFEEHGYIITMMSVRPKAIYQNAMHREWRKVSKEDWFQRELANLGQQEIWEGEVYASNSKDTWGFQDRYDEYRTHPSQVTNDFTDTLNTWHLAREFDQAPTLNTDFVECVPSDRIFQVPTGDNLWIMANHRVVARRLVPKKANPRIL